MIPEIRLNTDRLTLRTPIEEDFAEVAAFMASPRARFVGGPVQDEFARWRGFLGSVGHWALKSYGMFTLLHEGRHAGRVGVIEHLGWDEPELGWQLFDGFEGRGFACEAAIVVRRWARVERGLGPLISYIHPDNHRSRALARRLGARHESETTLLGFQAEIWRHPDPVAPAAEVV